MFLPAIRTFCCSFWLSYSPEGIHCGEWWLMILYLPYMKMLQLYITGALFLLWAESPPHIEVRFSQLHDSFYGGRVPKNRWCEVKLLPSVRNTYWIEMDACNIWLNNFLFASMIFCSGPLWGFVVAFMLFNIKGMMSKPKDMTRFSFLKSLPLDTAGSNLYFWIAIIPVTVRSTFQSVFETWQLS